MSEDCWSLNYCPLEQVNRFLAEKLVLDEGRHDTSLSLSLATGHIVELTALLSVPKFYQ